MAAKNNENTKMLRFIYMLDVDNRGQKSKYYGQKRILYTGQTHNLVRRLDEHLVGVNSKFLRKNFKESRKTLVFVGYVFDTEDYAVRAETKLKYKTRTQKLKLIESDSNKLVDYFPFKAIILKKYGNDAEQTVLRL